MSAIMDAEIRNTLEERLMQLDGIIHAAIDGRTGDIWVVRDPAFEEAPIELAVRNRLANLGHDATGVSVRVTLPSASGPRRRVRFVGTERAEDHGRVTITVRLEWNGVLHAGSATGDKGHALELKTTAQAALDAIEKLSGQSLDLRIIGVKPIHAFDSDLLVASLIRTGGAAQRLVGAVVVHDDLQAATALAVLSALNRTLGNFLHTSD